MAGHRVRFAVAFVAVAVLCGCSGRISGPADPAAVSLAPGQAVPSESQQMPATTGAAVSTTSNQTATIVSPQSPGITATPQTGGKHGGRSAAATTPVKGATADVIRVTKCYTNATASRGGELLIKASSSDRTARLFAYRPDGGLIGEVQNNGGARYGGTVMPYQPDDVSRVTIKSSAGGAVTVPTTPFQPEG